jgi:hypothetical protein
MRLARFALAVLLALPGSFALADEGKNYVVTIDGQDIPIDLGDVLTVPGKDGKDIKLGLRQSPISSFHGDFVSFQHGKEQNVTSTVLQDGLKQHMMATNTGTLVIVQEYADLDPGSLADLMLTQMSKDDLDGTKLKKSPSKRTVAGGTDLQGLTGVVTRKKGTRDLTIRYEVMTLGIKDHGIVAVTRIDNDLGKDDQAIIDKFWSTLAVKL